MTRAVTDTTEFAEFYAANFPRIATQIHAYLGDHAEAQDVTQEAFCRALDRWARVSTYDHAQAWVRQVAWNLATSRLRRQQVAKRYLARQRVEHIDGPSPDRVALVQALAKLPPKQRLAVVLHHIGHLSTAEIAQQQGVAEGTVRSWLSRGRARLAAHFQEPLSDSDSGIQAPGVQAADVAVRRRRTARRATIAAVLALAIAIPVAIMLRAKGDEPPVIEPTPSPVSPSPGPAWLSVSVPGVTFLERPHAAFVDGRHAWLLIAQQKLAYTSNGGVSWLRLEVPGVGADPHLEMYPLDARTLTLRVTEDKPNSPERYLLTRDAGETWTSYPAQSPPAEAEVARHGRYHMRCPGDHGFVNKSDGTSCQRYELVKIGSGAVSPQPPLRSRHARAVSRPDGRVWVIDDGMAPTRIVTKGEDETAWRSLPDLPEAGASFRVSPDGRQVWCIGREQVWELDGEAWRPSFVRQGAEEQRDWPVYVGDGVWFVSRLGTTGAAFMRDGKYTPIPELPINVSDVRVLPDGTLHVPGNDEVFLGYGTGQDRSWVRVRF